MPSSSTGRCANPAGLAVALLAAALAAFGCAGFGRFSSSLGDYVWVDDLPGAPQEDEYLLGAGDLVQVRVFNQDTLNFKARIRRDGRITLPLVAEIEAAGLTPIALATQIQVRLKEFINGPVVTVSVEEPRQVQVSLLGEVVRPGLVVLEPGAGLLQALAACGGLTDFAHRDRIFLLRAGSKPGRIRFDLDKVLHGGGRALSFRLMPGDAVSVE